MKSDLDVSLFYGPHETDKMSLMGPIAISNFCAEVSEKYESLKELNANPILKERILHKYVEEVYYLLMMYNYIILLLEGIRTTEKNGDHLSMTIRSVGHKFNEAATELGLILTPSAISEALKIKVEYTDYLMALLRLAEEIVEYTSSTIVRYLSIGYKDVGFALPVINQRLISHVQQGFQTLDLKNDSLRRKYDGLKYSVKKLNEIVYDLSLRGLLHYEINLI